MRFEFWERRLSAVIDGYSRLDFKWGKADCCTFAADCVWALTQKDALARYRGAYDSEFGAGRHIVEAGGLAPLFEAGMRAAGIAFERIAPAFGQRGDPCVLQGSHGDTMGVIHGAEIIAKAPEGLVRVPLLETSVIVAWAIR